MESTADLANGLVDSPSLEAVRKRISDRFGLVPSFFMMARVEPPIVEAVFGMVEFAYFDSPLPTLFKERLFTYVSRFCAVPIAWRGREAGRTLSSLSHASGDLLRSSEVRSPLVPTAITLLRE
jgi:hypothetical protein